MMLIHQPTQRSSEHVSRRRGRPGMKPRRQSIALPDHAERRRRLLAETMRDLRLANPLARAELIRAKIRHCRAVLAMYPAADAARLGYPDLLAAIIDAYGSPS